MDVLDCLLRHESVYRTTPEDGGEYNFEYRARYAPEDAGERPWACFVFDTGGLGQYEHRFATAAELAAYCLEHGTTWFSSWDAAEAALELEESEV